MPALDFQNFGGIAPKLSDRKLPEGAATIAQNIKIQSGDLEPMRGHTTIAADLKTGTIRSIYKYNSTWFSFNSANVSLIASPVAQDQYDRVYYTGDGVPKVTSNLIATGAGADPQAAYELGVPAPDTGPVFISLNGADPDPEDFSNDETRFYLVTYVTEYGEEGPPSPVSTAIAVNDPTQTVTLELPIPASNTQNITSKRLYRTLTGASDTDFYLVAEYSLATVQVTDSVDSAALGLALETEDYLPPDPNMQGLVLGPNGIAAGFAGNELFFSEPFLPYAYPSAYRRSLEYNIVGIAVANTSFIVVTEGKPYIFSGVSPDAMSEQQLELAQSCVSYKSLVDMGQYVVYASPDGLVGIKDNDATVLTDKIFTKETWADYKPSTIHAYKYENYYVGFYGDEAGNGSGTAGFMYDPDTGDFITFDEYATAGYNDLKDDTLYVVQNGSLKSWETSTTPKTMVWKSGIKRIQDTSFSCAKIHTDDPSNVNVSIWAGDTLVANLTPINTEVIRLAPRRATDWQFQISGTAPVSRITLATSMGEL